MALMQIMEDQFLKAAASLREGLEGTLTFHKLGVAKLLRDRLRTTNIIESISASDGLLRRVWTLKRTRSTPFHRTGSGMECSEH